jgi:hypothetical protein
MHVFDAEAGCNLSISEKTFVLGPKLFFPLQIEEHSLPHIPIIHAFHSLINIV